MGGHPKHDMEKGKGTLGPNTAKSFKKSSGIDDLDEGQMWDQWD